MLNFPACKKNLAMGLTHSFKRRLVRCAQEEKEKAADAVWGKSGPLQCSAFSATFFAVAQFGSDCGKLAQWGKGWLPWTIISGWENGTGRVLNHSLSTWCGFDLNQGECVSLKITGSSEL